MNTLIAKNELVLHSASEYRFMPRGKNHVLEIRPDDTMKGEIECGETIAIDITPSSHPQDGIYAFWWEGIFMVKRLHFMSGMVRVIPESQYYMAWQIDESEYDKLTLIGRVTASQNIRRH
ncbi:S24 family peptidase [Pantoea sp. BAV 3049]|uniref:S24 family peptidase n=1 Tax=Pantoea sp. BAV 3049 TaxID=2654188 RepID=UPI00131CECBC|nr:S24 family peptidase [Pantoea sp. BAV 3049]